MFKKEQRVDGENVNYNSHIKCFKTNHQLHDTKIMLYIVMEGAWYSSDLIIHIIIILITIAISIFTSFIICYFIFLTNIFLVTMLHNCIINVLCALRNLFSVKPFNITTNQFKPIMK